MILDKKAIKNSAKEHLKYMRGQSQIVMLLKQQFPGLKLKTAERFIRQCEKELTSEHSQDILFTKGLHLVRYYNTINWLLKIEELPFGQVLLGKISHQQWLASRNRKSKACHNVLDTMQQAETLIGIHNESFTVEINEDIDVTVNKKKPNYDWSKLTFEEMVELMELVRMSRSDYNEPESVQVQNTEQQEIIDGKATVLNPEVNIDLIQLEQPEISANEMVKDPGVRLRESLFKIAAKKFQEIGANLDDKEKEYLK
jgi:hypothetical protein